MSPRVSQGPSAPSWPRPARHPPHYPHFHGYFLFFFLLFPLSSVVYKKNPLLLYSPHSVCLSLFSSFLSFSIFLPSSHPFFLPFYLSPLAFLLFLLSLTFLPPLSLSFTSFLPLSIRSFFLFPISLYPFLLFFYFSSLPSFISPYLSLCIFIIHPSFLLTLP